MSSSRAPSTFLLLKGGAGSGNRGHAGRPGHVGGSTRKATAPASAAAPLPSSALIATADEARSYWIDNLGARTFTLNVKVKSGTYAVEVSFAAHNSHAWTRAAAPGEAPDTFDRMAAGVGPRVFDLDRAVLMDRIISTIERPWRVLGQKGDNLFLGASLPRGGVYTLALKVERPGICSFKSAYPRTAAEVNAITARDRSVIPAGLKSTPLRKSRSPASEDAGVDADQHGLRVHQGTGAIARVPRPASSEEDRPIEAVANMARLFSMLKALGPGERWITVHPHGPSEKGQPLLIKEQSDGSAKVIGGAGGSMNHLRLTGVRSEADYRAEAQSRDKSYREKKKNQAAQDKKDGLKASKDEARQAVRKQLQEHQSAFVETVADALGWSQDDMRFPEEKYQNASDDERSDAAKRHATALLARAKQAVNHQRAQLLQDGERRAESGLGEVPLTSSDPDQITVQDLDPVAPVSKGLGFSTDYKGRAEAAGLTEEALQEEAKASKPDGVAPVRKPTAEKVASALKAIRDPGPKVDALAAVDAKKAVELLKADKALKAAAAAARAHAKTINEAKAPVEPKAFVIETKQARDADIEHDLESDLRTIRTRAFLDEVGKTAGNPDSLGRHVGVGAYNSINALALAATGTSQMDRSAVDVLGIAGAAQVLARRLQADLTPEELEQTRAAMSAFHVDHYMALSDKALREARDWHEMAQEIEIGEAANGSDLAVAQELNAKRREFGAAAQEVLGTALGEMEANAALVVALKQPQTKDLQVSMGRTTIEDAIRQVRAIGLDRGDYQIAKAGASTILTVSQAGMDRLTKPVSREDLAHVRGALDIIEGRKDQDGWLPLGVADRPDMAMNKKAGVAPTLAKPFPKAPADHDQAIRDFIGGRAADGDSAADIIADLLNEDTMQRAGDRGAFMAALDKAAPLYDADGQMVRAESHQAAFEKMADEYVAKLGGDRSPLHRQQFPVDDIAVDALHRALAEHPEGASAFKPIGELTPGDQRALRGAFMAEYGRTDPESEATRAELEKLDASEPEKETEDMFGRSINPEWRDWQGRRNELAEKLGKSAMTWGKYLEVMGSPANGYAAMQDVVRSKVLGAFAKHHNTLRPEAPLKVGRAIIAHDLNHLDALDPEAREKRLAEHRDRVDGLRNRVRGQYAAGGVSDKIEAARAADEAAEQAQMGMFGGGDMSGGGGGADLFGGGGGGDAAEDEAPVRPGRDLALGERNTIGHAAEQQVAQMMPIVGSQFKAGQPVKLWRPDMSGKFVGRQRAVKLIEHNKRMVAGLGIGSGKTAIGLSGFTNLHGKGKAKRGLFLVPSIVQGQFHGEALTLLQPGKFKWHADPSASREERIAAYKDPETHFSVVTHQGFRDDMLHLAAKRESVTPQAIASKLDAMKPEGRQAYMRDLMQAEGIDHDYLTVDEGHNLLNRAGKANSGMANVVDAVADNMPYYVNMTADPVKNDATEAFDVLSKMDRARYSDRDAFMRKYGVNTPAAKEGLKREMARHFYTGKIDPGVKADKKEVSVDLGAEEKEQVAALDSAAARARSARMKGGVDVEALRTLSPGSFADVDEAQHGAIAEQLNRSIGILHNTAMLHAVSGKAKTDAVVRLAHERRGKPGVVFSRSLERVKEISERLKAEGHRVVTLTGADSSAEKDRKKREYQAGKHDVMVASDAAAVGANLQAGKWLAQYDTPQTAMLHAQRNGRINRMGQTDDVELIDLVANHPSEKRNRKRLSDKYELRDVMTSPLEGLDDTGIAGYLGRARAEHQAASEPAPQVEERKDLLAA
jgi:hypothetical protein